MNHEDRTKEDLEQQWFPRFVAALNGGRAALGRTAPVPEPALDLLYWGDLFWDLPPDTHPLQGVGDELAKGYYAWVRRTVLQIDRMTKYDPLARPNSFVARRINRQVRQTAMYMANAPIARVEQEAEPNVYDQIQYRFRKLLERKPDIVIGHSLGSVIAYEGLCKTTRRVPVLLTVGSPIGVPGLIYDKLRPAESEPRSAPNVRDWVNVSNVADPMVVPVPEIAGLFRKPVRDVLIQRGKAGLKSLVINHKFVEYLKDPQVGKVIAEAFEAAVDGQ
jgi:hypothetical protein